MRKRNLHTLVAAVAVMVVMIGSAHAGDRTLTHAAVIDAPVADVWRAFTEPEEMKKWMVAAAKIDLRIGGAMTTSYNPDSTLDDKHTIVNRILSFEPQRMLSIQNVRAPEAFENAHLFQDTWTVIYFEPLDEARTRIRSVGFGYGEGPEWDDVYEKFVAGNTYTYQMLQQHFTGAPGEVLVNPDESAAATRVSSRDAERTLELLGRIAGGEWIHESEAPDGSIFRVRNVIRPGPDGVCLVADGWLGDGDSMDYYGASIISREPGTGRVVFRNVDENGAVAEGEIRAIDGRTLHWDWVSTNLDGVRTAYDVRMVFDPADRDTYRFILSMPADDGPRELVNISYTRVNEAPERFRILRNSLPQ